MRGGRKIRKFLKRERGFTLVELLLVIVVLLILLAIIVPRLRDARGQAQLVSCKSNLRNLQSELAKHHATNNNYPQSLDELALSEKMTLCPLGAPYAYLQIAQGYEIHCQRHGRVAIEDHILESADGGNGDHEDNGENGNGGELPDLPYWEEKAYQGGQRVIYDGRVFEARYYANPNQKPGELGSPWQELTDQWRNFNVYEAGDTVLLDGKTFQARHWTYNQEPGLIDSPWQELTDQWRDFNVYEDGDVVYYNGKQYRAKHYSKNAAPGSSDAWELVP